MKFRAFFVLFFALSSVQFSAIKITSVKQNFNENLFAENHFPSSTRTAIALSENWTVYPENNPEKKARISIPAVFETDATLVFTNRFVLTDEQIENYEVYLHSDGLNYLSEISINDQSFIKLPYGGLPFEIAIPNEILLSNEENKITVKINSALTSNSTVPQLQRFLFPNSYGGILGKIKVLLVPKNKIVSAKYDFSLFTKKKKNYANLTFRCKTQTETSGKFKIKTALFNDSLQIIAEAQAEVTGTSPSAAVEVLIKNPQLWTTKTPRGYYAKVQFFAAEKLTDEISLYAPLLKIEKNENGLTLNGKRLQLRGVTYVPFSKESNPEFSYEQIKKDFALAKGLGFNFIRFANQIPDKIVLALAEKAGFLTSVEIPVNYLPEALLEDEIFSKNLAEFSREFVNDFSDIPNVALLGCGGSLLPGSDAQISYVNKFARIVKENSNKFSFGSFLAYANTDLDFVNIEIYSRFDAAKLRNEIAGKNVFITGTYPAFEGGKSGSLVKNSYEAQGSFFKKLLAFALKEKTPGVFINSLVDYSGDFNSLYASYSENRLYKIGIVGTDRKAKRIGYNVIREKLKQGKNVVIPLGRAKSDFPLLFVVLPLFLAALIAFVINSRRKFREDATRALLRSYNFFSDIRDMRLLSGFHSYFMFVVNSATFALLVINVLYFLRSNIVLDKVVVALGSPAVSDAVAFLAWRPVEAFSIIFAFFISLSLAIALTIKFFSIFLRGRFLFSSIFYTVVWAFMPINLLIPVELLLLKMLGLNVVNFWIYLFLAFYLIWLVMRLFKGVYVIFDIRPSTVYLYGVGLILFIFIAIAFYFQTTANAYDYLSNALAQMKFLM